MRTYLEFVLRFRWSVIAAVLLATAGFLTQVRHLEVVIDLNKILPDDHPYVVGSNQIERAFGIDRVLLIALTPRQGDIFSAPFLEKVQGVTRDVAAARELEVSDVFSLAARRAKDIRGSDDELRAQRLMPEVPRTPEALAQLRRALDANPVFTDSIVSRDRRTAAVIVDLHSQQRFSAIMSRLEQLVEPYRDADTQISITGTSAFNAQTERYSQRLVLLFPLVILVIGLIHYEAFRSAQGLLLPLLTALLAVIWGLGLMGALRVSLDAFNVTTPVLILAVAAGHAVQILKRYYEDYAAARLDLRLDPQQASRAAVLSSLCRVGPVMLAAGGVACLSFLSLLSLPIATIRSFGVFSALGIAAALVLELSFIPALRSLLPPPGLRETQREQQGRFWDRLLAALGRTVSGPRRGAVYAALAALLALLGWGASRVELENSLKSFFYRDQAVRRADERVNQALGGTNTLYVMLETPAAGELYEPARMRAIARVQRALEQDEAVGKTISIADFIAVMNREMHGGDPRELRVPDSRQAIAQYLLLYESSADPDDFRKYVDPDYRSAAIWSFLKTDSTRHAQALIERLRPLLARELGPDVRVQFGGSLPRTVALNEVLVHAKLWNVAQLALVIFGVSCLLFRSLQAGAFVLVPLALTVLANFGLMGWAGIPLNTGTAIISALAVGIGADYAIYLLYRIREEVARGRAPAAAVQRALGTAGVAILFVACAVAGGYAVLLFSYGFYVHLWFGVLIACSMLVSAAATLLIVPAALLSLRPRFVFGSREPREEPAPLRTVPAGSR